MADCQIKNITSHSVNWVKYVPERELLKLLDNVTANKILLKEEIFTCFQVPRSIL